MINSLLLFFTKPPRPAGNLTLCLYSMCGHSTKTANTRADFQLWLSAEWTPHPPLHPHPYPTILSLSPFLLQTLSSQRENLLLAQFKWNLPSYRWILTFNILAPLLESVYPTFIMQYVLLSPSGPQAFTLQCLCFTSHKPRAPVRWRDGILTWTHYSI